jgi:hypothetical protein
MKTLVVASLFVTSVASTTATPASQDGLLIYFYQCDGDISAISLSSLKKEYSFNAVQKGLANKTTDGCPLTSLIVTSEDKNPNLVLITPKDTDAGNDSQYFQIKWSGPPQPGTLTIKEPLAQAPALIDSFPSIDPQSHNSYVAVEYVSSNDTQLSVIPLNADKFADLHSNDVDSYFRNLAKVNLPSDVLKDISKEPADITRSALSDPYSEKNKGITGAFSKLLPEKGWIPLRTYGHVGMLLRQSNGNSELAEANLDSGAVRKVEVGGNVPAEKVRFNYLGNWIVALTLDGMAVRINTDTMKLTAKDKVSQSGLEDVETMCLSTDGLAVVRVRDKAVLFLEDKVEPIEEPQAINDQTQCTFSKGVKTGLPIGNVPPGVPG